MGILNSIKKIYSGKRSLGIHISLFSILGIMTLCFNNKFSSVFENFTDGYFGYSTSNKTAIYLYFVAGIVLLLFSIGYVYDYIHRIFEGKDGLPETALSSLTTYVRMLPLFIVWGFYWAVLAYAGYKLLDSGIAFYLYFAILLLLPLFINIIYAMSARDFRYKSEYYNPLFLLKVADKTLGEVLLLFIKMILLGILPALAVFFILKYSIKIHPDTIRLGVRLGTLCLGVYLLNILRYIYSAQLVEIINKKLVSD